ncbi:hypothetical protein E2320_006255 [Naja naja]|nr:hypothetical protein E2320_006255 [Naja naja]
MASHFLQVFLLHLPLKGSENLSNFGPAGLGLLKVPLLLFYTQETREDNPDLGGRKEELQSVSLLRDAPQDILHCVGEGREAHYNEQVRQSSTQESVVAVSLLEAEGVGHCQRRVPVKNRQAVLPVMSFPVGDDIWKWESRWPAVEIVLVQHNACQDKKYNDTSHILKQR